MTDIRQTARDLLRQFKGDKYAFGLGCLVETGRLARSLGKRAAVVAGGRGKGWGNEALAAVLGHLRAAGVEQAGEIIPGAAPNSPREDAYRIATAIRDSGADSIVAVGGGSVIDAAKGSQALVALGDLHADIDEYFGAGKVSAWLKETGRRLVPMTAVELAASSAAHLTKYANITNTATSQKMLIIDEAVTPARAVFDYRYSASMSAEFTADGAMDGLAHCLEVFYGSKGAMLEAVGPISLTGIELVLSSVKAACRDGGDMSAREALGLATDLGGNAIMVGGTSGAHLTSFSLVDVLPHGRACAMMNPYYTVFFAPAIEPQLRDVAAILHRCGWLAGDCAGLRGRELGLAVAGGLQAVAAELGMPLKLRDVPGFGDAHIRRALEAAKTPQLESKLRNMPVPLSADTVDDYMGPVLQAAATGDFSLIRNMRT